MQNEKNIKKYVLWLVLFIVVLVSSYLLAFLPVDFSREYRKIPDVENIIFKPSGQSDRYYKRCIWGLGRTEAPAQFRQYQSVQHIPEALQDMADNGNQVCQAVFSPDGKYILYSEIAYNYKNSGLTDDEYCYYKIYNIETKETVTIYQAYREWYNLDWQ